LEARPFFDTIFIMSLASIFYGFAYGYIYLYWFFLGIFGGVLNRSLRDKEIAFYVNYYKIGV